MEANNFNTRDMGHDVSDQPRLSNGQFTFKGSATATMPSHQQAALEAPMPVSQNAPLEERMYPASVADVVKRHANGDHSTLHQYSQEPNRMYNLATHNCQQYFAEVLQQAQEYATKEKPLVLP